MDWSHKTVDLETIAVPSTNKSIKQEFLLLQDEAPVANSLRENAIRRRIPFHSSCLNSKKKNVPTSSSSARIYKVVTLGKAHVYQGHTLTYCYC